MRALTRRVPHSTVLLPAAVALLALAMSDLGATATTLRGLVLLPTFVGVCLSAAGMWNRGQLNRAAQRAMGIDARSVDMARVTTVAFAANKVIKSGGLIGLGLFLRHARRRGHRTEHVMSACVLSAAASFAALAVIVLASFVLLAALGRLTAPWAVAAGVFGVYVTGLVAAAVLAARAPALVARPVGALMALPRRILRRHRSTRTDHGATVIEQIGELRGTILTARTVYWYALESKLYGTAMLMAAVAAAGHDIDPVTGLIVYTTILLTSLVAFVPGGIGIVEASGAAMLVGIGMPLPAALLAVTLFRVFDVWLPVVTGFALGREELRATRLERDRVASSGPIPELARAG